MMYGILIYVLILKKKFLAIKKGFNELIEFGRVLEQTFPDSIVGKVSPRNLQTTVVKNHNSSRNKSNVKC